MFMRCMYIYVYRKITLSVAKGKYLSRPRYYYMKQFIRHHKIRYHLAFSTMSDLNDFIDPNTSYELKIGKSFQTNSKLSYHQFKCNRIFFERILFECFILNIFYLFIKMTLHRLRQIKIKSRMLKQAKSAMSLFKCLILRYVIVKSSGLNVFSYSLFSFRDRLRNTLNSPVISSRLRKNAFSFMIPRPKSSLSNDFKRISFLKEAGFYFKAGQIIVILTI